MVIMNATETNNKKPLEIKVGGMWEESSFEIRFNEEITDLCGASPCPHCGPVYEKTNHGSGFRNEWTEKCWLCPRVVVAKNEGGCNSTGVCLDCILDASKLINESR